MRIRTWIGAAALAGIVLAPLAAIAQTAKVDDVALKSRIEKRLKADASFKKDTIKVESEEGAVTLSGTVRSTAQKTKATELAKVTGVTRVDNKLEVSAATEGTMEKAMGTTGSAVGKAADKTGTGVKKAATETGEAVTDAWITSSIKTDFVDEATLKGSDINADTNEHVVTLKGTVTSEAGRTRAVQIAKTTKGVNRVIDQLTIAPPK